MIMNLFTNTNLDTLTYDIFEAYYSCRRNKRNTINALSFEVHFERKIFQLIDEIREGKYEPGKSIAFIVKRPVKREIFAADFRDRVVHHFVINKLNPLFERLFINDSYACRVGKGTHFGIQRINQFIKSCSKEYSQDCYILKLDVQGFFMHIDKTILYNHLSKFIHVNYTQTDKEVILLLLHKIIFYNPVKNCVIKGKRSDWDNLPKNKSLFHSPLNCGLPIGNLTSQVFANFYMNCFDHFIKNELGLNYYGRYVDDFVIVHTDKEYLKSLLPIIRSFLKKELHLTLHPQKMYLQHYSKGVQFLGTIIKPNRIYIASRTKSNFYITLKRYNKVEVESNPSQILKNQFLSSVNSYLGILKHYQTFRLRRSMILRNVNHWWKRHIIVSKGFEKIGLKKDI